MKEHDVTEKLRAAAQQALAYILATGEHDQLCDVLDFDDEGRHKPCSCLLQDVLDALRAALAEQQEPEHISSNQTVGADQNLITKTQTPGRRYGFTGVCNDR